MALQTKENKTINLCIWRDKSFGIKLPLSSKSVLLYVWEGGGGGGSEHEYDVYFYLKLEENRLEVEFSIQNIAILVFRTSWS